VTWGIKTTPANTISYHIARPAEVAQRAGQQRGFWRPLDRDVIWYFVLPFMKIEKIPIRFHQKN
jgi:hypothetical protein